MILFKTFKVIETLMIWLMLILFIFLAFYGRPSLTNCDPPCPDVNHTNAILYTINTIILLIGVGIMIYRLIRPILLLRIISWIIFFCTVTLTILNMFYRDYIVINDFLNKIIYK